MLNRHLNRKIYVKLGHLSEKKKAKVWASSGALKIREGFLTALVASCVITHQADVPSLLETVEHEDEDLQQAHGQHEQRWRQTRVLVLNIFTVNCGEGRGHANLVGVFVGDKKFHSLL